MSKFRPKKIKVEHHILPEIRRDLERIAAWAEVDGIIPGVIKPKKGKTTGLSLQYETASGLKLLGRSTGAAQEVFIITQDRPAVTARLMEAGLLPPPKEPERKPPR